MIVIEGMSKRYWAGDHFRSPFADVDIKIPTDRAVAILGAEGSGKSALIRMLSGLEGPTEGIIRRYAEVSFPVGSIHAFRPNLTGRQNAQHAARVYGADPEEIADFVAAATELGELFDLPIRRLPSGLRGSVAWAIAYAIPFDTYLIDENIGFGPTAFRIKCMEMLRERGKYAGYILATNRAPKALQLCDCAVVIAEQKLHWFDDMRAAEAAFDAEILRLAGAYDPTALPDIYELRDDFRDEPDEEPDETLDDQAE